MYSKQRKRKCVPAQRVHPVGQILTPWSLGTNNAKYASAIILAKIIYSQERNTNKKTSDSVPSSGADPADQRDGTIVAPDALLSVPAESVPRVLRSNDSVSHGAYSVVKRI